ncbi:hypothetical protein JCM11251_003124 [Rhodosporidiobolus azoricus]
MPPTRRSESAPRRSSRAADIQKDKDAAQKKKAAAEEAQKKKQEAEARKAAAAKKSKSKSGGKSTVAKKRPTTTAGRKAAGEKSASAAASKKRKSAGGDDEDEDELDDEEEKEAAPPAKTERKAPTDRSIPKEKTPKEPKKPAAKKQKKDDTKAEADEPKKVEGGKYKIGDVVEDVKLKNEDDKDVSLAELYAEKGLVIFSYPKANTPGCTTQACNFRDTASAFGEHSFTVVGLSRDKPSAQMSWKSKHELGYSLLSDPDAALLKKLGATEKEKRCHWIIEKGGKLLEAKIGVKPADDAKNALKFVEGLSGKGKSDGEEKKEE